MEWTENDINYLINNYEDNGPKYVAEKLNKSTGSTRWKANKLNLKIDKVKLGNRISIAKLSNIKPFEDYNVNPSHFFDITTPEMAYILGILWADGCGYKDSISIWLVREDLESIEDIFFSIGKWNKYFRYGGDSNIRREQMAFQTSNKVIFNFLKENGFGEKSHKNQNLIMEKIPTELKKYFIRGFFDGDGTVFHNKNQNMINITSTYEQDWTTFETLFDEIGINYSISRVKNNNNDNKCSRIVCQNIIGISLFYDYLYGNSYDGIGFERKYNKLLEIKNKTK